MFRVPIQEFHTTTKIHPQIKSEILCEIRRNSGIKVRGENNSDPVQKIMEQQFQSTSQKVSGKGKPGKRLPFERHCSQFRSSLSLSLSSRPPTSIVSGRLGAGALC
jgi:hypothetical protein